MREIIRSFVCVGCANTLGKRESSSAIFDNVTNSGKLISLDLSEDSTFAVLDKDAGCEKQEEQQ